MKGGSDFVDRYIEWAISKHVTAVPRISNHDSVDSIMDWDAAR